MAGNYWIKFYTEVLDDPKMAMLDDHTWRRFYELCLMAGRENKGGLLPTVAQMAWLMRIPADGLQTDVVTLIQLGLITVTDKGFVVTNFGKRQKTMSNAERQQRYRGQSHYDEYYGNEDSNEDVTERYEPALQNVTQITDNRIDNREDNRTETDQIDSNSFSSDPDILLYQFKDISNCPYIPGNTVQRTEWLQILEKLRDAGVTPDIMARACDGAKVMHPQEILAKASKILQEAISV